MGAARSARSKMSERESQASDRFWYLRRPSQFLLDLAVLSIAFFIANLPAVNVRMDMFYSEAALRQLPFVILVQFSVLFMIGAYSIIWRYISIPDIKVFLKAAVISGCVLIAFRFASTVSDFNLWQIPISVILIDTVMAFGGLLAMRILRRFLYEFKDKSKVAGRRRVAQVPTLIIGAGRVGATLVKAMVGRVDGELNIRGFVDDDPKKRGGSVGGVKVLGSSGDLARLVHELGIEQVVIALEHAQGKEIRKLMDLCASVPVKARIVPGLDEIARGSVSVSRIRDVQIEDLLGRDPIRLDDKNLHEFLCGKTVMVTGAGGSIGSELVRQIVNYEPKEVLLIERAEYFLFQIGRELAANYPDARIVLLIADVGDEPRMSQIFEKYRPEIIFHAAAHKHVPLMESNTAEAIKNNVFATRLVGRLAGENGAAACVLISTDKAVNPTSVMGASKRVAEIVLQDLNSSYDTKYVAVRFGNVLGSAGSVIPIFREQIEKGGPVTITHKDMTRYFMTIPEASQLVLQAGALGQGAEIFILDMGKPVKIVDLAGDMIRLSGLTPYEDIDIQFTGIRKGEKLFEELEISGEDLLKTRNPKIFIGKIAVYPKKVVEQLMGDLQSAVAESDEASIRRVLVDALPEATITTFDSDRTAETVKKEEFFTSAAKLGLAQK